MAALALDILQVGRRPGMGMAHMDDQLVIADTGLFHNTGPDLAFMGVVVPPTKVQAEKIQFQLRISAPQEQTSSIERSMNSFRRIVHGAAPGARIDAGGRGDVGACHAHIALEFRLADHKV